MVPHVTATAVALALTVPPLPATAVGQSSNRSAAPATVPDSAVENVIVLIGDGMGSAYWTAARWRGDSLVAAYTTEGHTGEMTPHFASGPGATAFSGVKENREIGRLLLEAVR